MKYILLMLSIVLMTSCGNKSITITDIKDNDFLSVYRVDDGESIQSENLENKTATATFNKGDKIAISAKRGRDGKGVVRIIETSDCDSNIIMTFESLVSSEQFIK